MAQHIAIIRLSAIGDLALAIPSICNACLSNKDCHFTVVTKAQLKFLVPDMPNLSVITLENTPGVKGLLGLWRLRTILLKRGITTVVDLHDVLRTRLLQLMTPTLRWIRFSKARKEKRDYIAARCKVPVTHTSERYNKAFFDAGILLSDSYEFPGFTSTAADEDIVKTFAARKVGFVGIAPFAAHLSKTLPAEQLTQLIESTRVPIVLFAGKENSKDVISICNRYSHVHTCFELTFLQQILLMRYAKAMICVDSSNMHLAALQGAPLASVWGGTHIALGFAPLTKNKHAVVETPVDQLSCRPCSVYGNKKCTNQKPYACLAYLDLSTLIGAQIT
jgi:ADP-heptose:LPS heptosyltransferase